MKPLLFRLWRLRRWPYAAYMLVAVARIPARVGFHLLPLRCDTRLTADNLQLSMTKVPHMVLFGIFFIFTVVQFDEIGWRAAAWSTLATFALGLLVEFEEGWTRTGNCRLTDVAPDMVGAIVAAIITLMLISLWRRLRARHAPTSL